MTEKRFIYSNESIINIKTDELVNASSEESAKILVDWLNELSDKYAEQRKENYGLLDGIAFYKEENASLSERISDLECENEQLKKELKRCKDWINSDKNDYELTLSFIKNKGYSLKDVLEYEKELKSE